MNRCRIHKAFLSELIKGIRDKPKNRRIRLFLEKWQPVLQNGKLYWQGKQVIPYEDVEAVLKKQAEQNGMPLSRDGAYHYMNKKYIGFKKRTIGDWLKRVEQLQLIHKRPHKNTRINRVNREGITNYRMAPGREGRFNLGVDLFMVPKEWSAYSYFFVAVLQRNGYTWAIPMTSKTAKRSLSALKRVFADCKARFGSEPTGLSSDDGAEFKGAFDEFLQAKSVPRKIVRLCSWVEKKNSTLARAFAVMIRIHGFNKSLELSLEKINNIRSRINNKSPVDWTQEDFQRSTKRHNRKLKKHPKPREQPVFTTEDRVRYMLKKALGKDPFYKSYEGMRKKSHHMWSYKVFPITERRQRSGELIYKVNGRWRPAHELQLVEGELVTLTKSVPPKQVPKKRSVPKPAKPRLVGLQVVRRPTRVRRAPVRYGY